MVRAKCPALNLEKIHPPWAGILPELFNPCDFQPPGKTGRRIAPGSIANREPSIWKSCSGQINDPDYGEGVKLKKAEVFTLDIPLSDPMVFTFWGE